jgi:ABC-2 type transport system ATP-binding protein
MILYWLFKRFRRWREQRRAQQAGEPTKPTRPPPTAPRHPGRAPLDGDAAISVRGLRKAYPDHEAVRGIDFDVQRGEIVAFLGPNGAGKTTTVEMLEGYRPRSGGEIRVLGEDPADAGPGWRDAIGVVLQESEPEPYLTARQCLELYAGYYATPRPIQETLELVGLQDKADAVAGTLSGGQRRRLDVALALIGDPALVFLDEPTTGFDPSARRAAWQVVAGLRDLGKTIFLTTHYMDEAENCDRIAIIDHGNIVAIDTPEALKASIGKDRIQISTADDQSAIRAMAEVFGVEAAMHEGLVTFSVESGEHFVPRLFGALPVAIRSVSVSRPSLDDVFMSYTGKTIRDAEASIGDRNRRLATHFGRR